VDHSSLPVVPCFKPVVNKKEMNLYTNQCCKKTGGQAVYPNMNLNLKSDSKLQIFNTGGVTLGKNSTQFHKTFLTDLFSVLYFYN